MRYWIRLLILGCFMLMVGSAQAFAEESMKGCPKKYMHEEMQSVNDMFFDEVMFIKSSAAEIGLSGVQLDKIMTLKLNIKKSLIKYDADIESLALDIKSELGKDSVNMDALNSLIDKKYSAKAQEAKELTGAYINLKKILTKEQAEKLKTIRHESMTKESQEHMGMGMQKRMMRE